jgi:prophage tail gpP-like protein
MSTEKVSLLVGGFEFTAWEECEITAAIDEPVRCFAFETTERPGQYNFPPGTPATVLATGSLLVTGYINQYRSSGSAKTHRVSIRGRGKGQDFVDCAATHKTGYTKNKTPGQFGQELDHFGVGINEKVPGKPIPVQRIEQGETCFRCVERHLRHQGTTMMGEADGSISITNASVATRAGGALVEGVNIKEWTVEFDDQNRHSEYTVKGQNREGSGEENLRIKEQARDSGVRRYRPKLIVHETDTDKQRARERAHHEKERCAGKGTGATITVQGWRDGAGALWTPNTLVFVASPILMHLVQDMLIESVGFTQSSKGGTETKLKLVDPRAYRGQGQNGKGSDPAWNAGYSGGAGSARGGETPNL